MTRDDDNKESKDKEDRGNGGGAPLEESTSPIEWITAAIGAAILLAMISYLAVSGYSQVEGAPQVAVSATAPIRQASGYLVAFKATNTGQATATSLIISARLMDGEREIEQRAVTIDYLPMQSSRGGGLFFSQDPARFRLTIEAQSYLDP